MDEWGLTADAAGRTNLLGVDVEMIPVPFIVPGDDCTTPAIGYEQGIELTAVCRRNGYTI